MAGVNGGNVPKAQRKRSHDARFARDYRAITQCAQRSRAAPIRPRASNLLIVGTRSHEQPEKQSVIIARSAGRHSRQIAARYPRGRSRPVRAPRDGLCGPSVARRAAHHLSFSLARDHPIRVARDPQMLFFCNSGSRPGGQPPSTLTKFRGSNIPQF